MIGRSDPGPWPSGERRILRPRSPSFSSVRLWNWGIETMTVNCFSRESDGKLGVSGVFWWIPIWWWLNAIFQRPSIEASLMCCCGQLRRLVDWNFLLSATLRHQSPGRFLKLLFPRAKEGLNDDAVGSFLTTPFKEIIVRWSWSQLPHHYRGLASKCILIKRRFPSTLWFEWRIIDGKRRNIDTFTTLIWK